MVSTRNRGQTTISFEWNERVDACPRGNGGLSPVLPLAQVQLDITQHFVALARDLVFHERPAPGAEELAEHRPVVYLAAGAAEIAGLQPPALVRRHAAHLLSVSVRPHGSRPIPPRRHDSVAAS